MNGGVAAARNIISNYEEKTRQVVCGNGQATTAVKVVWEGFVSVSQSLRYRIVVMFQQSLKRNISDEL